MIDPQEQFDLLALGIGVTNAAARTTPGSGDLRRGDFDRPQFEERMRAVAPRVVAFVGKEAYRGLFNERPELGPQLRVIGSSGLFVLPSTSPANAAVPYADRLHWFQQLHAWLEPVEREAVRAIVIDDQERVLLTRYVRPVGDETWWGTPGGGIEEGETHEHALRRELREEIGLHDFEIGPLLWAHTGHFAWDRVLYSQHNHTYLVRVGRHEARATIDLAPEGVAEVRWSTIDEIGASSERFAPPDLGERIRTLVP